MLLLAAATLSVATLPRHRIGLSSCSLRCTHYWGEHNYNYSGVYNLSHNNTVVNLVYTRWLDPNTLSEVPGNIVDVTISNTDLIVQNVNVSISRETGMITSVDNCVCMSPECNVTFCSSPPRYFKIDLSERLILSPWDFCEFVFQGRSYLVDDESNVVSLCGDNDIGRFNTTIPSTSLSSNTSVPPALNAATSHSKSNVSTVLFSTIVVSGIALLVGAIIYWLRRRGFEEEDAFDEVERSNYLARPSHPQGTHRSQYLAPQSVAIYDNETENDPNLQHLYEAIETDNENTLHDVDDAPLPPPRPSMYAQARRFAHKVEEEYTAELYDVASNNFDTLESNNETGLYDSATMSMPHLCENIMVTNPTYTAAGT